MQMPSGFLVSVEEAPPLAWNGQDVQDQMGLFPRLRGWDGSDEEKTGAE